MIASLFVHRHAVTSRPEWAETLTRPSAFAAAAAGEQ